jgi:hypothetical protein
MRDVLRGLEETHYDLYWDIQAELEKIEHKHNNVGYLYKQKDCYGEIETVFSFDKPYITWHNVTDVTPVYLEPPEREPLSYEEINAIDLPKKQCTLRELVRIIEKAHGIGVVE